MVIAGESGRRSVPSSLVAHGRRILSFCCSRSSSGSHHGSALQPMTSSSPQVGSQRLSFAFTTFGGASGSAPGTPPGEMAEPSRPSHHHSHSASSHHRRGSLSSSGGHGGNNRKDARDLTPREVVDLARETAQVNHQEDGASSVAGGGAQEMEPVEFVPLADEVLLPFDERPQEVQDLMDEDRNRPLFRLIEINFPKDPTASPGRGWKAKKDSSTWTYADFATVLGKVGRSELPDAQWARLIRNALKPRSEPLWEKLKGCLGIEEDEFDDGEIRLVGESVPGSPSLGYDGAAEENRIFIEGLVEGEGVLLSDEQAFGGLGVNTSDQGRRASSDDGGNALMAGGGLFSPESAGDGGLPPLNSLTGGSGMESIGEAEEESPPPSRQTSTETRRPLPSDGSFPVPPAIRTTVASPDADPTPRSSFSFHPTTDTPTPSSPSTQPFDLRPITINQTYQPTSPLSRTGDLAPSSPSVSTKSRSKSFVGISILSSSPSPSFQAPPLSPTSQGASSYTPSLDDASYGGRHYEGNPASYRGPGSPLFPSSFASLSLGPMSGGSGTGGSFGGRRKMSASGGH